MKIAFFHDPIIAIWVGREIHLHVPMRDVFLERERKSNSENESVQNVEWQFALYYRNDLYHQYKSVGAIGYKEIINLYEQYFR